MSDVENWSTVAANNNSSVPDGAPEGMQPAGVNDVIRENMRALAKLVRQFPWLRLTAGATLVRNSNVQFQITGADHTGIYTVGRRLRQVGATTVFGTVSTVSFTGGNTLVDVTNDAAAAIPSSLTAVDVAVVNADSNSNIVSALNTISIPAAIMYPATTSGCAIHAQTQLTAGQPELLTLDFDGAGSAQEYALFSFPLPKRWNEGTITARVRYTVNAAVATTVKWDIQALAVGDNEAIAQAYGTLQSVTDTFHGTANRMAVTATTSAITVGNTPAAGDEIFFRIGRDPANDTTTQDAKLIGVEIFYTIDASTDF
jgi:hypothetical protein